MAPKGLFPNYPGILGRDLDRIVTSAHAFEATSRAIQEIANLTYPTMQRRWLGEIADLDVARILGSNAARQIAELVESYTAPSLASVIASVDRLSTKAMHVAIDASVTRLSSIINGATTTALIDWINRLEDRAQRDADAHVRSRGWWTLPSWTDEQLLLLGAFARDEGKAAFTARLCGLYRRSRLRLLRRMVGSWMDLPSFRDRRPIIMEALKCHWDRRYRVAIPALLPLVEGIVGEEFPRPPWKSVPRAVRDILAGVAELDDIETAATLSALDALYQNYRPQETKRRNRGLNRHGILHGYALSYGSEGNSLRVFGVLDLLHSQALTRRKLSQAA